MPLPSRRIKDDRIDSVESWHRLVGFPVQGGYRYKIGDRRFRLYAADLLVLWQLGHIYEQCAMREGQHWAVHSRKQIRMLESARARPVLSLVIRKTKDPVLRILAIWLRGRCGGTLGTSLLAESSHHHDDQPRKETARALKRMSAWHLLRSMAAMDVNPRIRRMAVVAPPASFKERPSSFIGKCETRPIPDLARTLFVSPELNITQGKPPRSRALIRKILERIRQIVSGTSE
jgi:hypothetical protein